MFLAPLNYDQFFKKVFSDLEIAKAFLQDFLEVKITSIEVMPERYRLTDDASIVEFDYRCKIDGKFVIIDMQQWRKQDIVHRFYLYHCLNTSLQLADLPLKRIYTDKKGKQRKVKDYSLLYPTITLVWLVDDCLGSDRNTITSFMQPEEISLFINDDELWCKEALEKIKTERENVLKIAKNATRGLEFLATNRLTFALQHNIARSITQNKAYAKWFLLAEKTRNSENTESDFKEFEEDDFNDTYLRIKKRISASGLSAEEADYLTTEAEEEAEFNRGVAGFRRDAREDGMIEGRKVGREEGIQEGLLQVAKKMKAEGMTSEAIAQCTGISL